MAGQFETFYAKILLFGEYSLMYGSGALSIPFREKQVRLLFPGDGLSAHAARTAYNSNNQLKSYLHFLVSKKNSILSRLDLQKMHDDIALGMYLDSSIPNGYGLGSSGALVAALFHKYDSHKTENPEKLAHDQLLELKQIFSLMESFFHGSSSGLDPLSIYVKKPLYVNGDQKISVINTGIPKASVSAGFFLLDTHIQRKTGPLVQTFKTKYSEPEFHRVIHTEYVPACDSCISSLLKGSNEFHGLLHRLSDLQLRYFREMIPAGYQPLWAKGLSSGLFTLKLCGAGGGGYLLGYSEDTEKAFDALLSRKNDLTAIR